MGSCVENFRFEGDGSQIPIWSRWVLNLVWGQIVIDWLHRKSSNDLKVILTCKLSWESLMGRFRKEIYLARGQYNFCIQFSYKISYFWKKCDFWKILLKINTESIFWASWMGIKWKNTSQWLSGPKKSFFWTFTE